MLSPHMFSTFPPSSCERASHLCCPAAFSRRHRLFAGLFAATLSVGSMALAQEEVWVGPSSGVWSNGANWLDGSAPAAGGDLALTLRFTGAGTLTASDDLAGPFFLNRLVFDTTGTGRLTVAASAGALLRFAGGAPRIELRGAGSATLSAPLTLDAPLTIGGTGAGQLAITGAISAGALVQPLVFDSGA